VNSRGWKWEQILLHPGSVFRGRGGSAPLLSALTWRKQLPVHLQEPGAQSAPHHPDRPGHFVSSSSSP